MNGGKRLRPFLVYTTGKMLGAEKRDLDVLAAAIMRKLEASGRATAFSSSSLALVAQHHLAVQRLAFSAWLCAIKADKESEGTERLQSSRAAALSLWWLAIPWWAAQNRICLSTLSKRSFVTTTPGVTNEAPRNIIVQFKIQRVSSSDQGLLCAIGEDFIFLYLALAV